MSVWVKCSAQTFLNSGDMILKVGCFSSKDTALVLSIDFVVALSRCSVMKRFTLLETSASINEPVFVLGSDLAVKLPTIWFASFIFVMYSLFNVPIDATASTSAPMMYAQNTPHASIRKLRETSLVLKEDQ